MSHSISEERARRAAMAIWAALGPRRQISIARTADQFGLVGFIALIECHLNLGAWIEICKAAGTTFMSPDAKEVATAGCAVLQRMLCAGEVTP